VKAPKLRPKYDNAPLAEDYHTPQEGYRWVLSNDGLVIITGNSKKQNKNKKLLYFQFATNLKISLGFEQETLQRKASVQPS
jgi:hypothetical protein